ncbi:MAG: transglycosylase SLT domain-containing protein, partial [Elusimicrobia bacterium]|nr:transglycosylase SLT domain-containing protein [Elusimicrobiota bacterium]
YTFGIVCVLALLIYTGWLWKVMRPVIHKDIINKYAGEYKFDPLLIMALVKVESNFASKARSHRGAVGLMQLLPSTAEEMAVELGMENFTRDDLEKPEINIRLGYHYLAKLRNLCGEDTVQMLAAYNAGYQKTLLWKKDDDRLSIDAIEFPETKAFVNKVLTLYKQLREIQRVKNKIEL